MKKFVMSLTLAALVLMPVSAVEKPTSQSNVQEVQMQQPKAKPEDKATEEADKAASDAEEKADKAAEAQGSDDSGTDTMSEDMLQNAAQDGATDEDKPVANPGEQENVGVYKSIKTKFIEGNAGFMSLVALALVIGLAFCIERIIYLSLSEINAKKFMEKLDAKISSKDIEGAKELCRNTRGPVASICLQGLIRINETLDNIERSVVSYGSVQSANLE